ncbi:MAG: TonB-dependent receptor [Chitinophagaceae bacterium]|nr:TonB-dependent receptor [Chitinophagaceae bacterium]
MNIITKTFQKNTLRKHFRFRGQAGEYELFNGDVSYHSQIGKTSFAAGLITNHAKGEPLRGTTGFFHNTTASASAGFSLKKDWRIHVRMAGDIRHFNAQNFYTTFFSDTAKENVKSWWNHVHIYKKANNGYWQSDISFKRLQDIFYFRPSTAPNKNFTTSLNAQMLRSLRWKKLQFTGGVQSLMRQIKSNDRGNHQLWHTAFFGILQHQIGNHFFLNESVRLGWDENYGWIFVPQFSASYTKEKLTLRSSAGRSFRDADFTERYNNYNKPVVTAGRIGNPFLNAERSFSAEIGFDYKFTPSLTIRSSGFGNFHKGLIDWVPTPYSQMPRQVNLIPNGNYALARNIEDVQTLGAECDAVYYKEWGTGNHVMLTAGMIWMHNRNPDSLPAFYLNGFARFLKNFSFSLRYGSFTFSMNGLYKLRNAQKANAIQAEISRSYFVLNAKISYLFWKQRGMIFVMADNLFDTRYSDILGARMPGRWISGGFQIDLPKF